MKIASTLLVSLLTIFLTLALLGDTIPNWKAAPRMQIAADRVGDSLALVAIYDLTDGTGWNNNTNWKSGLPMDTWYGVRLNANGRVDSLNLSNNNLQGVFPADLSSLTELEKLNLSANSLTGIGSLDSLSLLTELNLDFAGNLGNLPSFNFLVSLNRFIARSAGIDSLPALSNQSNLTTIFIGDNPSLGSFPPLDSLQNLAVFDCGNTGISSIPYLPNPSAIFLFDCGRNSIPNAGLDSITQMINVRDLSLDGIPGLTQLPVITNPSLLRNLVLSDNPGLTSLPSPLPATLISLRVQNCPLLDLSVVSSLTDLQILDVDNSDVSNANFPDLSNLTSLRFLETSNNQLDSIPGLGQLTSLEELWASNNQLIQVDGLDQLINLYRLYLSGNPIQELPDLSPLTQLTDVRIFDMQLRSLHNLPPGNPYTTFNCSNNRLTFDQLEPYAALVSGPFTYAPQDSIAEAEFYYAQFGDTVELFAGDSAENSSIQWFKGGVALPDDTTQFLEVSLIDDSNFGRYNASITNVEFPGLTLNSFSKRIINASSTNVSDSLALVAIYNATDGPNWAIPWILTDPVPSWFGVEVGLTGRVESLDLSSNPFGNNLQGEIPVELSDLTALDTLNLSNNPNITGFASESMFGLGNLQSLSLFNCNLLELPQLDSLQSINQFNVGSNRLSEIPGLNPFQQITGGFIINNNRLTFDKMEPFQDILYDGQNSFSELFLPQDSVGPRTFYDAYIDSFLFLTQEDSGLYSNYEWFQNGIQVFGEFEPALLLDPIAFSDSGLYYAKITHDSIPVGGGGVIYSRTIRVSVRDSSEIPPNGGNDILVYYQDGLSGAKRDALDEYWEDLGIQKLDSCECNNLEHLLLPDQIVDVDENGIPLKIVDPEIKKSYVSEDPAEIQTGDSLLPTFNYPVSLGIPEDSGSPWFAEFKIPFSPKRKVVVAIIDFGVDSSHSAIRSSIHTDLDTIAEDTCYENDPNGYNFELNEPNPFLDEIPHGTSIAGIIKEIIPNPLVEILSLQVGSSLEGRTEMFKVACALKYAIEEEVDVINLSLGYTGPSDPLVESLLMEALQKGIVVVTSAGNNSSDNDVNFHWPSNYDFANVIAVGAINSFDTDLAGTPERAPFTNYGFSTVDLFAPGVNINSPILDQQYGPQNGTSVAAAFVTAVIANIISSNPSYNLDQVLLALRDPANGYIIEEPALLPYCRLGARLNIELKDCGKRPIARPDTFQVQLNFTTELDVLANDCYGPNVTLSGSPTQNLLVNGGQDRLVFTPDSVGNFLLTYTLTGSTGIVDTCTIYLQVVAPFDFHPYPNPFSDELKLDIFLPRTSEFNLKIVNALGQSIWKYTGSDSQGLHQIVWDGRMESGLAIPPGTYVIRFQTRDFSTTSKVIKYK